MSDQLKNDNEFFVLLQGKDFSAFQQLVRGYFPILCKYAEQFVSDPASAKDVVQEIFIKFWQYKGSFATLEGLKAFLFTATRNECYNLLRNTQRRDRKHAEAGELDNMEASPVYEEIRMEYLGRINLAVQQMPEKMREIFLLTFEEGLSVAEIAKRINVSVRTVRNQKYRALVVLRKKFGRSSLLLVYLLYAAPQ